MVAAQDPWFFPVTSVAILVLYVGLASVLPAWWTSTDYCPGDPTAYCSGLSPLMLAFVALLVLGVCYAHATDPEASDA